MGQGYKHDIFISYRREGSAFVWAIEHFIPLLKDRLRYSIPSDYNATVFIDSDIRIGNSWSIELADALRASRCLLSIWSPDYFRSNWCVAELYTMLKREEALGLRQHNNSSGLIYPVVFKGVKGIPKNYKDIIQYKDLSAYGFEASAFKESPKYLEFSSQVEEVCDDLWQLIRSVPKWQDNWPLVTPEMLPIEASPNNPFTIPGR